MASSASKVDKMKRSEVEVIREWLEDIFKSWEKTNDLKIEDFKFDPLRSNSAVTNGGGTVPEHINGGSNGTNAGKQSPVSQPRTLVNKTLNNFYGYLEHCGK